MLPSLVSSVISTERRRSTLTHSSAGTSRTPGESTPFYSLSQRFSITLRVHRSSGWRARERAKSRARAKTCSCQGVFLQIRSRETRCVFVCPPGVCDTGHLCAASRPGPDRTQAPEQSSVTLTNVTGARANRCAAQESKQTSVTRPSRRCCRAPFCGGSVNVKLRV